jgi:superfamily II DNA or RNA helicase
VLSNVGVRSGQITAGSVYDDNLDIQTGTIQTLSRRDRIPADIVVIDECHHAKAKTYMDLFDSYPEARFLGVTATPCRTNGEGFDDVFETLVSVGNLSYFFENGFLCPVKHMVCGRVDTSKVKKVRGDYENKAIHTLMSENHTMAKLVKSYIDHCKGKKIIVFAVNVKHSEDIVLAYKSEGISAAHIDSNTPEHTRKKILENFRKGSIRVLSNVDIVSEGFDVPDCDGVQLARPTKSLSLYLQQVGRCMRPSEGKEFGVVLDNAGLYLDHGLCFQDRVWTLKGKKKDIRKQVDADSSFVTFDNGKASRISSIPAEVDMEMFELNPDNRLYLRFEEYLQLALDKNYKVTSAFFRMKEYFIEENIIPDQKLGDYILRRMKEEGRSWKDSAWKMQVQEIINEIEFKQRAGVL